MNGLNLRRKPKPSWVVFLVGFSAKLVWKKVRTGTLCENRMPIETNLFNWARTGLPDTDWFFFSPQIGWYQLNRGLSDVVVVSQKQKTYPCWRGGRKQKWRKNNDRAPRKTHKSDGCPQAVCFVFVSVSPRRQKVSHNEDK